MNEPKFTKGNLWFERAPLGVYMVYLGKNQYHYIAQFNALEDACLFTAAPEMYDMLTQAYDHLKYQAGLVSHYGMLDADLGVLVSKMHSVLAKARGEV